jgi:hypothetical protein
MTLQGCADLVDAERHGGSVHATDGGRAAADRSRLCNDLRRQGNDQVVLKPTAVDLPATEVVFKTTVVGEVTTRSF